MHCHLLPGVDDGCQTFDDAVTCIGRLEAAGFVGSICTPHIWPELLPLNTPSHVEAFISHFAEELSRSGIDYRIWPGGELRLFKDVVEWMKVHGVPTLAQSRCVLFDHWAEKWPKWAGKAIQWLLDEGYQPIMAHPERLDCNLNQPERLDEFVEMGVWMQGNFLAMTGEDGPMADALVRQYLAQGRYQFMALDAHAPESVHARLDGMRLLVEEFGPDALDRFTIDAPRELIFGSTAQANPRV